MAFTTEEKTRLSEFVSNPTSDIYVIQGLAGIIGAVFARYSRAQGDFREIFLKEFIEAGELDPEHAKELIERILISYGDDSVGELEGAHLSGRFSNLATKEVEDRRIGGSPIEQSSRFVRYDSRDENGQYQYLRPREIIEAGLQTEFEGVMDGLFDTYSALVSKMQDYFRHLKPITSAEYDILAKGKKERWDELADDDERAMFRRAYNFDIRSKACDTVRILLPACTLTNVGLFGNGRFFQNLLTHLYSHPLQEMNTVAEKMHRELDTVIEPYVRRAGPDQYRIEIRKEMDALVQDLDLDGGDLAGEPVTLFGVKPQLYYEELLAQSLFSHAQLSLLALQWRVRAMSPVQKAQIWKTFIGARKSRRDRLGRAAEFGYPFLFQVEGDFGIYRDLQRHRMLTQERQLLTPYLGYEIPQEIIDAGYESAVIQALELPIVALYEEVRERCGGWVAQYVVPFGFKLRWTMGMNLREAQHMLELRTIPQGHPSYRKICQEMARQIMQEHPWIEEALRYVDYNDYLWTRDTVAGGIERKLKALTKE